jgi:hypothetical protein
LATPALAVNMHLQLRLVDQVNILKVTLGRTLGARKGRFDGLPEGDEESGEKWAWLLLSESAAA